MALKYYQNRLRGEEVVWMKVQGDAKGGGVAEVGRLDFKTSLRFFRSLGGVESITKVEKPDFHNDVLQWCAALQLLLCVHDLKAVRSI